MKIQYAKTFARTISVDGIKYQVKQDKIRGTLAITYNSGNTELYYCCNSSVGVCVVCPNETLVKQIMELAHIDRYPL